MSDRTINFGESETEATYQIQDTDGAAGGGNFVIAKDTNANTVLLQYNPSTDAFEYAADVDLSANAVTAGTLETATVIDTDDGTSYDVGDDLASGAFTDPDTDGTYTLPDPSDGIDVASVATPTVIDTDDGTSYDVGDDLATGGAFTDDDSDSVYTLPQDGDGILVASVTTGRIESQRLPPYDDIGTVAVGDVTDALQNLFSEPGWADPLYRSGPAHGEGGGAFQGAALAPDGRVILAPRNSSNVGIFDPADDTYTSGPAHGEGGGAFVGAALAPDGRVIFAPYDSSNVGIFDPADDTYTSGPAHGEGGDAFQGAALAPDGRVILAPYDSSNVGIYDGFAATENARSTAAHPLIN